MSGYLPLMLTLLASACTGAGDVTEPTSAEASCGEAQVLIDRAQQLIDLGTPAVLPQAREFIEQAESHEPACAALWLAKGRLERSGSAGKGAAGPDPRHGKPGDGARGQDGREDKVLAYLEHAFQLEPEDTEVLLALSSHLFTVGERGRADELVRDLLRRDPEDPRGLLLLGETLVATDALDEAVVVLERGIEAAHSNGDRLTAFQAQGALGQALERQGRLDDAESLLLRAAVELDAYRLDHPGQAKINCPHESLTRLYARSGDRDRAARHAAQAADIRAWMPELQYQAARVLLDVGDIEGARIYLERGQARDLGGVPNPLARGVRRRLERADRSMGGSEDVLASALRLADLYLFERARTRLEGVPECAESVDCRVLAGFLALLEGDTGSARSSFEAVLGVQPGQPGARVGLGHVALEGRDHDAALDTFQAVLLVLDEARAADDAGMDWMVVKMALLGAAWCHQAQGRDQRASEAFARVLAHRPDDVQALLGQGNALNGLQRAPSAQEYFQRVLFIEPAHPQALAGLGTALYNQGEYDLAEAVFEAAQGVASPGYSCPFEGLGLAWSAVPG